MDDFEYSVEISNRDWASFFVECEECDLLPPSLAGVDDSGMSDIDDHFLAHKAQRANSTTRLSENDLPVDSTPDSEGSPVERSFGKPGIGGIDSVLSGSEEDIHMQSINVFFEKLKGLTEIQPSQERAGNNKEAMQEEERCGDGQQAIRRTSPKTCPEFNMLPERGETGGGKETVRSVDTIRTSKTIAEAESSFSSSTSILCRSKPAETELFIKVETVGNELTQLNQCHNSTEQVVWSEITPQSDKEELCRSMENSGLLTSQEIHSKKWSREDQVFTQETSPSVSMKRKRRKKRRLSAEVCEDEEECAGRVLVKQVGSKEEPHGLREGASLCLSKETLDYLKEPQKSPKCLCAPNPATIKLQRSASPSDTQNQHLYQRRSTAVSSAEKLSAQHRPEGHPSRSEGDVTSAAISSGNEAADLQPCSKLQVEESAGRNLPVSATQKPKSQPQNAGTGDLHQSDETQNSVRDCKNEQNLKYSTAPVKAVGLLTNTESCAPGVQVSQNDNLSAAKSVLAAEAGNSCRDKRTLCRSEAEPQQQLENDCHDTNQCHAALEHAHCPVSAADEVTSPSMTRSAPHETSDEATCNDFTSDRVHQLPGSDLSKNQSGTETEQETDHPIEVQASDILLKKDIKVERTQLEPSQTTDSTRQNPETKGSLSENVQTSPSVVTYVSSCCALDSESIISTKPTNQTESSTKKLRSEGEETFVASKQPEKTGNSVFAMSSFWNEMEKLTINDILGLRQIGKAAPPLPPVQEREETEMFPVADSGFFNQVDESKPEEITEEVIDSSALRCVSWECEPAPVSRGSVVYSESPTLTSVSDASQPVLTERTLDCLRKISKTVSVHNLQALESEPFSYTSKNETMNISEERESESFVYISEDAAPKKEKETNVLPSSSTGSYSISFADIFQYLFGGKQSVSSQSATDDKETFYTSGSSVPETYDQFFSEYDDENFFYPLRTVEEKNKDQLVPIFSYSRSACRNLQFPEAYEHFFASSSSDDSSVESDEEDHCRPVRVVSRFTRKASSTQLSKDTYEDFFSDKDLKENFFSLKSLSFRKMNSTAPTVQNQSSNSLVPVKQSPRYTVKVGSRLNVLGNQDGMFPDPLLDHLENRITHQLTQQPFRYEDLQATASNPRSDAPLLPLKQSDMCLVCIAFASWVLKTANPQVGDAWKAVLLANVSALSAIRYLRKYVRVEAAASEIKPHQKALKDS